MKSVNQPASALTTLTNAEWHFFKDLIYKVAGIALSPSKKALLVSRLGRRLKVLGLSSFSEYYQRILNKDLAGEELQALVNAITTNKTEFFREPHHFELLEQWLRTPSPGLQQARLSGLHIWCAAASTGEEPYTIAAVVRSVVSQAEWGRTTIFATDLDTNVLQEAEVGSYNGCDVEDVPEAWRERLFSRGRNERQDDYVVRPELKARVQFSQLNLVKSGWTIPRPLDVIFCRNVLIYFDKATQLEVVSRQCRMLAPHGLLFLGHSEGLTALDLRLESIGHTAYRALANRDQPTATSLPQLRAVSLNRTPPPLPHPYVIGAEKKFRLFLRAGILVAMFSSLARQTCVAVIKDECSSPAGVERVHCTLDAMLRALRQLGGTVGDIQAKTVGVEGEPVQGERGDGSELQSEVHGWLAREALTLAASRLVPSNTEIRIDLRSGRVLLSSQVALIMDTRLMSSAPDDAKPRKAERA